MSRESGIALPLAVVTLLIVVSLTLALGALSISEPVIAANQLLAAQARAAADSGLESALAAFSNTQSLATGFAAAVEEAPFTRIPGTRAGYRIAITVDEGWTTFEKANQRRVTVAGIAAGGATGHPEAAPHRAVKMVEAIIRRDSLLNTLLLPAAATLPAGGTLKADIDARRETAWCTRHGSPVMPSAAAAADGAHDVTSLGASWGPGNDIPNEDGPDILHRRSPVADFLFANQALSTHELAALQALAISTGTFYRGSPVLFDGRSPLPRPETVVYVEGDVEIEAYGADTIWTGWMVSVRPQGSDRGGDITFRCSAGCSPGRQQLTINGLLYAEGRLQVNTPTAQRGVTINGGVITRNLEGAPSLIDPRTAADFRINLRCQRDGNGSRGVRDAIAGTTDTIGVFDPGGRSGWYVKPGSVREIAGHP